MIFRGVLIGLLFIGAISLDQSQLLQLFQMESIRGAVDATYLALVGLFALGMMVLVSAVGLLMWKRLGWVLAMVSTGIFVVFDILSFVDGTANYIWMALNVITVFYLNQREVRESVGAIFVSEPTPPASTTAPVR